jgi:hypothetical protein
MIASYVRAIMHTAPGASIEIPNEVNRAGSFFFFAFFFLGSFRGAMGDCKGTQRFGKSRRMVDDPLAHMVAIRLRRPNNEPQSMHSAHRSRPVATSGKRGRVVYHLSAWR